jgi:hypothetical protein
MTETTLSSQNFNKSNFPELPIFIISSLIFLDGGILLGALNSFRFKGFQFLGWEVPPELHQSHWTSTLLGGVTFMIFGQMYFFFSQINGEKHEYHRGMLVVWGIWLIGILSSYVSVWSDNESEVNDFILNNSFKVGSLIFVLLLATFFFNSNFIENFKNHYSLIFFPAAAFWLLVAVLLNFDIRSSSLDRMFLFTYIYGFFSLALFGSLSFVLPIIFKQKPMSRGTIRRYFILLNLAAVLILGDLYMIEERGYDSYRGDWVIKYLGPAVWGLAGFLFILWVFDLIYKAGVNPSLIALLVALMMFGFFVLDTFMKNAFPVWVDRSHFHFLFIGTLLLTIIAIGSRIIIMQYTPDQIDNSHPLANIDKITFSGSSGVRTIGLLFTIAGVCGVLFGFTIDDYKVAGWSGILLFFSLLFVQITMVYQLRLAKSVVE